MHEPRPATASSTTNPASLVTLVLNADFRPVSYFPLSVCSWQDAIKALFMERVQLVSEYDTEVHSPSLTLKIPSVIALRRYVSHQRSRPPLTRQNILLRDKYTCQYCDTTFPSRQLTLDHMIPSSKGGLSEWDNLVAACHPCNRQKGDKMPGINHRHPTQMPYLPSTRELQANARTMATINMHESWEDYL